MKKASKTRKSAPKGRSANSSRPTAFDDVLPEYPAALIREGRRGKYAARYAEGTNVVVLDPDVAAAFPTSSAVNSALRTLLKNARAPSRKVSTRQGLPRPG